jgi:membrane protease YdiL (CAAX protease family)
MPKAISNKTRAFEILAVILTAAGKFLFMDYLKWKLLFIMTAILFWGTYVLLQHKRKPGITKYWGFRKDNFVQTIKIILPFAAVAFLAFIAIGIYQNTIHLTWHILPLLILYPVWGSIQQFLLIALTAGNLQDLKNSKTPKAIIILLTALLFGLIHYPFVWLMAATFVLAIFYCLVYLKHRNIYALGIFHGWLGALFFYTVVNRDPFIEVFGPFLHLSPEIR